MQYTLTAYPGTEPRARRVMTRTGANPPGCPWMRLLVNSILLSSAVASSPCVAGAFELSFGASVIDGPNEGLVLPSDRRVKGIRSGEREYIQLNYGFTPRWTIGAEYGVSSLEYADPRFGPCPFGSEFLLFRRFCQADIQPRIGGLIEERMRDAELRVTHQLIDRGRFSSDASIGYKYARWDAASEDTETADVVSCGNGLVEGCSAIREESTGSGVTARLRAHFRMDEHWTASVGAHYQGYRHVVWRNDVVERFYEENCGPGVLCYTRENLDMVAPPRYGSWSWFSAELRVDLSPRWEMAIAHEARGSRTWAITSASVSYRWE